MATRVRFAPSPSGYLHLGLARTALFNWLWARRSGGAFVVRVEDTDQERSSPESVAAILDALRWLGLDWDEGPEAGGNLGPYYQSERRSFYQAASERLLAERKAYRCYCTKEELDQARKELKARDPKAQFVYPGTCRERRDEPDLPFVVRFKSPQTGTTDFVDRVFGRISTPNREQQDFVIQRSDGFPLYNLACVVDDDSMGIALVARGRDHIGNTPLQILLYQALGLSVPEFAHLPMILNAKGEKLSKREGAVGVQDYRERGYPPGSVLNYLARFGWSHGDREVFSLQELVQLFDWESVNKSDGRFDDKKFLAISFEHLKSPELSPPKRYAELVSPFLKARGLLAEGPKLEAAIETVRPRARTLAEAAETMDYYFREPPVLDPKAREKFLVPTSAPLLSELASLLETQAVFQAAPLEAAFRKWTEERQIELKEIAQPARVALTGRTASPALFEVLEVLGREQSLTRLRQAAELCQAEGP
jgi:glutamyl-tRNA synthetase